VGHLLTKEAVAEAPLIQLRDYLASPRTIFLCGIAAVIGMLAALIAKGLVWLIGVINSLSFFQRFAPTVTEANHNHLGGWVVLVPVLGGLLVGLMIHFGTTQIRGHGIPEAMESALFGGSRMGVKVTLLKPIGSAVAIGTGGPFGAEGPIIMTGGAFGSLIAQCLDLTAAERRVLLGAGAAAGMSAIFAAPISSVIVAVDLLLDEWRPRSYFPTACAAAVAALFRIPLLGEGPKFQVGERVDVSVPWLPGLLGAIALGLAAGLVAVFFTRLVYWSEDLYHRLPLDLMWWPAIGGIFVGLGGYLQPKALGIGYDVIDLLLAGKLLGLAALSLLAVKGVIWAISLASGTSGGVLAPLLIIGGALGAVAAGFIPVGTPGLWVLVAMGAVLGSGLGSPLAGIVFMVEVTANAHCLPELVAAGASAGLVSVLVQKHSLMTEKVVRRGHHVARDYASSPFERALVAEFTDTAVPIVGAEQPLAGLARTLSGEDPAFPFRDGWPVVDGHGRLLGVLDRAALLAPDGRTAGVAAAGTTPVVARPSEELEDVVFRMLRHQRSWLPVVEDGGRPIGCLDRARAIDAWRQRRHEEEDREPGWLHDLAARVRGRLRFRVRRNHRA